MFWCCEASGAWSVGKRLPPPCEQKTQIKVDVHREGEIVFRTLYRTVRPLYDTHCRVVRAEYAHVSCPHSQLCVEATLRCLDLGPAVMHPILTCGATGHWMCAPKALWSHYTQGASWWVVLMSQL